MSNLPVEKIQSLRGSFERILCVAHSQPPRVAVGNHIELADRLIKAVLAELEAADA